MHATNNSDLYSSVMKRLQTLCCARALFAYRKDTFPVDINKQSLTHALALILFITQMVAPEPMLSVCTPFRHVCCSPPHIWSTRMVTPKPILLVCTLFRHTCHSPSHYPPHTLSTRGHSQAHTPLIALVFVAVVTLLITHRHSRAVFLRHLSLLHFSLSPSHEPCHFPGHTARCIPLPSTHGTEPGELRHCAAEHDIAGSILRPQQLSFRRRWQT